MSHEVETIYNPRPVAGSWRVQLIPDPKKWAWDLIVYRRSGELDSKIANLHNAPGVTPRLLKEAVPGIEDATWELDEVGIYNGQVDKTAGADARVGDHILHLSAFLGNEIGAQALVDEFNAYLAS